jgi:hypothetical protein
MSLPCKVQARSESLLLGTFVCNFYSQLRPFWLMAIQSRRSESRTTRPPKATCGAIVVRDAQIVTFVDSPWPGGGLGKNNFTITSKPIRSKSGEENRAPGGVTHSTARAISNCDDQSKFLPPIFGSGDCPVRPHPETCL